MTMLETRIIIKNNRGFHVRAAIKFINLANRFAASVKIVKDGNEIDGKNTLPGDKKEYLASYPGRLSWNAANAYVLFGIIGLAVEQGSSILLRVSGKDEEATFKALVDLINNKFDDEAWDSLLE